MKIWMRAGGAACMVAAVSSMIKVYGQQDVIFFNKGIISLGVFLLGYRAIPGIYTHWIENRRDFMIGYGMSLALMFTELLGTGMRLETVKGGVELNFLGVMTMAAAAAVAAFLIEPCFYQAIHASIKPSQATGKISPNKAFRAAWGILYAGYLPCVLAFFPGLYSYDMIWQWAQFDSWNFTTHHPLIHTLFSGGLIELGNLLGGSYNMGILLHSLVQTAILTGSMAFAIGFLVKQRTHPWVIGLTGAFFLFFPFFPVMAISTTKDTIFAALFLAVFVCICDMVAERRFFKGRRLALFLLCGVLMCLFRNNAIYGLAVQGFSLFLVWLIWKTGHRENAFLIKAAVLTAVCILLSQGMFFALEKGLGAEKGGKEEMMSFPMQQMARAYVYHQEEFSPENREELLRFFDEDALLRYKYYVSDPVKSGMRMENFELAGFVKLWIKLGRQFPGEYLKSPLYNMMGLWYMGGDSSCYMEYGMLPPFDEEHAVEITSRILWLKDYYSWFTDENLQKYLPGLSVFFYTAFYSWCILLAAGILAAKRKYLFMLLPLFLACYGFTLIFGPCIIVRYFLAIILCIPVLAVMTFQEV